MEVSLDIISTAMEWHATTEQGVMQWLGSVDFSVCFIMAWFTAKAIPYMFTTMFVCVLFRHSFNRIWHFYRLFMVCCEIDNRILGMMAGIMS